MAVNLHEFLFHVCCEPVDCVMECLCVKTLVLECWNLDRDSWCSSCRWNRWGQFICFLDNCSSKGSVYELLAGLRELSIVIVAGRVLNAVSFNSRVQAGNLRCQPMWNCECYRTDCALQFRILSSLVIWLVLLHTGSEYFLPADHLVLLLLMGAGNWTNKPHCPRGTLAIPIFQWDALTLWALENNEWFKMVITRAACGSAAIHVTAIGVIWTEVPKICWDGMSNFVSPCSMSHL